MPYYKGDTGTVILYDEEDKLWRLVHDPDNGLAGIGSSLLDNMGTGVQRWNINQDICGDGNTDPVLGLLTVCKVTNNHIIIVRNQRLYSTFVLEK